MTPTAWTVMCEDDPECIQLLDEVRSDGLSAARVDPNTMGLKLDESALLLVIGKSPAYFEEVLSRGVLSSVHAVNIVLARHEDCVFEPPQGLTLPWPPSNAVLLGLRSLVNSRGGNDPAAMDADALRKKADGRRREKEANKTPKQTLRLFLREQLSQLCEILGASEHSDRNAPAQEALNALLQIIPDGPQDSSKPIELDVAVWLSRCAAWLIIICQAQHVANGSGPTNGLELIKIPSDCVLGAENRQVHAALGDFTAFSLLALLSSKSDRLEWSNDSNDAANKLPVPQISDNFNERLKTVFGADESQLIEIRRAIQEWLQGTEAAA